MKDKATPRTRRKQRDKEKSEKQQASAEALRAIISPDAFSQPISAQSPRSSGKKGPPKLYLIVCEDAVSGRYYLEDLVDSMQLSAVRFEFVSSGEETGTDPGNVVACAATRLSGNKKIETAFVVFDGDTSLLGGTNKSNFDNAIAKAATISNMDVFVSVPCLEFWFVLHYGLRDTAYQRQEIDGRLTFCGPVCKELGQKISDGGGYKKSEKDIFDRLEKNVPQGRAQAAKYAQRLRDSAGVEFSHPSTDMDRLVQCLEALKTG